jgi:hypothetical protein
MSYIARVSRVSRVSRQMQAQGGDRCDPEHQNRSVMSQNMNTLEQDLQKKILGRSKAEKVFRPWWDMVEDYLLNALVLLGKLSNRFKLIHVSGKQRSTMIVLPEGLRNIFQSIHGTYLRISFVIQPKINSINQSGLVDSNLGLEKLENNLMIPRALCNN